MKKQIISQRASRQSLIFTNFDMSKNSANLLGYYFIIFQSQLNGFIKCWLDGSENYTYYSEEDFIGLFEKIDSSNSLIFKAMNCINTTGIYIWDITEETIKRATALPEERSLMEEVNKINPLKNKKNDWGSISRRII